MMEDDDDDDENDMLVQAVVAYHIMTLTIICEVFLLQEKATAVSTGHPCNVQAFWFYVIARPLSLDALLIFFDFLSLIRLTCKGSQLGKVANDERGQEAANQQLVGIFGCDGR